MNDETHDIKKGLLDRGIKAEPPTNRPPDTYCIRIDPSTDSVTQLALAKYQLIYSIIGLILGLASIIGGVYLFVKGISGAMNWSASFFEAKSNIVDAAPGAVLFIVGLFMVFVTRYKFKHIKVK